MNADEQEGKMAVSTTSLRRYVCDQILMFLSAVNTITGRDSADTMIFSPRWHFLGPNPSRNDDF